MTLHAASCYRLKAGNFEKADVREDKSRQRQYHNCWQFRHETKYCRSHQCCALCGKEHGFRVVMEPGRVSCALKCTFILTLYLVRGWYGHLKKVGHACQIWPNFCYFEIQDGHHPKIDIFKIMMHTWSICISNWSFWQGEHISGSFELI